MTEEVERTSKIAMSAVSAISLTAGSPKCNIGALIITRAMLGVSFYKFYDVIYPI